MKGFVRGLILFLSTGAFSGYVPKIPGTAGSVAGIGLFCLLALLSPATYCAGTFFFVAIAVWSSGRAALILKKKDPPEVVIDEIAGFLITMATFPASWKYILPGFILFRVLDIIKPYPANRINDRVEGGLGIVLDDVVAGIYANLILQVLRLLF